MFTKKKEKRVNNNFNEIKSRLSEQSVIFIKEIILKELSLSLPLSEDDFLSICDFVFHNYEVGLLNDEANAPRCGYEELHAKAVQLITEHSNNVIDIDDLNVRLSSKK